jgi:hypothetical protein
MDVLEAYDLTKSLRAAAQLTGVDHHTVARHVAARARGQEPHRGRSLSLPCGMNIGSTWNSALIDRLGTAPGRTFESFS